MMLSGGGVYFSNHHHKKIGGYLIDFLKEHDECRAKNPNEVNFEIIDEPPKETAHERLMKQPVVCEFCHTCREVKKCDAARLCAFTEKPKCYKINILKVMKNLFSISIALIALTLTAHAQVVTSVESGDKTGIVTSVETGDRTGIVTTLDQPAPRVDSLCIITTDTGFVVGTFQQRREEAAKVAKDAPRREAALKELERLNDPATYQFNKIKTL